MFYRNALKKLDTWMNTPDRKPLIIRGARQVGKTTLVEIFSKKFDQYIYLNLEKVKFRKIFEDHDEIETIVEAIFLYSRKPKVGEKTLIFIDEIQSSPKAVMMLRYFYEEYKELYIIAAGSLLETVADFKRSFPVGRVEYLFLYPVTFSEYLKAGNENKILDLMDEIPFPGYAHELALKIFRKYVLIGGMPAVVNHYLENNDIVMLNNIYESLLISYTDDIEKYAATNTQFNVIRYVLKHCFSEAGRRIKFEGFAKSNYKFREMREALYAVEKAMFIKLLYPAVTVKPPLTVSFKKSPKLLVLDTGLINFFSGLQQEVFSTGDLNDAYKGIIAEHIVGQELIAYSKSQQHLPTFWVREKSQSTAEVDYLYQFQNMIIPLEVKSGKVGKLRSLMLFIDMAPHNYAVRIYSGNLSLEKAKTTNGKEFTLLNLPFYLLSRLDDYLNWMINRK